MATPIMAVQNNAIVINSGSPNSIKFLTKTPAGVAIDVSSGYTVTTFQSRPASNENLEANAIDMSAIGTFTFGTTGVTWDLPNASTNVLSADLRVLLNNYVLYISNDGGTTKTLLAAGQLTYNSPNGAT